MERKKFKTTYHEKRIPLYKTGLIAKLVVEKGGQQPMHIGNNVTVTATLFLPMDLEIPERPDIHPSIKFENRVVVMDVMLDNVLGDWAYRHSTYPWIYRKKTLLGERYQHLFLRGINYLESEVEKINEALRDCERIFINAEIID